MRVVVLHPYTEFEAKALPFGRYGARCVSALMGLVTLTFDLLTFKTSMRVAYKVGNLPSKFGHARPLGSRIIRYVLDGRIDGRTKAALIAPFPTGGGTTTTSYRLDLGLRCDNTR